MKKVLLSLLTLIGMASVAFAQTTYTMSDLTFDSSVKNELMWTAGDASFHAYKNSGSAAPTYNSKYYDVRIYAKGTVTVSSTVPLTTIVFNLSTQGLKRLAPITASVGTITNQAAGDATVTWIGEATEVTFTVGDKADYGTDGSGSAGQLDFDKMSITYGNPDALVSPTFSPGAGTYYEPQTVTISCTTEGASLEYSTDGTEWTAYTEPLAVNASCTLYAKASLNGETRTSEAAYEILTVPAYSTLAEVLAQEMPTDGNSTEQFKVNFDSQVIYANDVYNYITDGTANALFYNNMNLKELNTLKGGWIATIKNYKGLYELIPSVNPTLGEDATTSPEPVLIADAASLTADKQNQYIVLNNVELTAASPANKTSFTGKLGESDVTFYNRFALASVEAGLYNVVGFVSVYNTTVQVYPISMELIPEPEPAPELTLVWETSVAGNTDLPTAESRYATSNAKDGVVLVPNKATHKIYEISESGVSLKYTIPDTKLDGNSQGTAIGCDEAGNIICGLGWYDFNHQWLLIPAEGGVEAATILDTEIMTGKYRAECVNRVIGDMTSEEGGLFFYPSKNGDTEHQPSGGYSFVGVHVANSKVAEALDSQALPAAIDNQAVVVPMYNNVAEQLATGDTSGDWASAAYVYTHNSPIRYWDFDANDGAGGFASMDKKSPAAAYGFDVFTLGGTTYLAEGYATVNWGIGMVIVDLEGNEYARWESDYTGAPGNYGMINAYANEDGTSADIYMFNCGISARKFTFSVPAVDPDPEPTEGDHVVDFSAQSWEKYKANQSVTWVADDNTEFTSTASVSASSSYPAIYGGATLRLYRKSYNVVTVQMPENFYFAGAKFYTADAQVVTVTVNDIDTDVTVADGVATYTDANPSATSFSFNVNSEDNGTTDAVKNCNFTKIDISLAAIPAAVESIDMDANAPVEYFNLQGIRVDNPAQGGVYIRRQGSSAVKVMIR